MRADFRTQNVGGHQKRTGKTVCSFFFIDAA